MFRNLMPIQDNALFPLTSASVACHQVSKIDTQYITVSYDLNNYATLLERLVNNISNKWILFIAPPGKPKFDFLASAGIEKSRVITLNEQHISDKDELLILSLKSGNYSAVISWQNTCNNEQKVILEENAKNTKTECFLFCSQ